MLDSDVMKIFKDKIQGDRIVLPDTSFVDVSKFAELFTSASNQPTHAELLIIDGYVDEETPGLGYKLFLDQCKADGILT